MGVASEESRGRAVHSGRTGQRCSMPQEVEKNSPGATGRGDPTIALRGP